MYKKNKKILIIIIYYDTIENVRAKLCYLF